MSRTCGRRAFLYAGGAALALAAGPTLLEALLPERGSWRPGPFGPLRPDRRGLLDLPEGFAYRTLRRAGASMSDGLRVPARPDGMACFELDDGTLALLCNHENPEGARALGPWVGAVPPEAYAPQGMGGVTRLVLDPRTLEVRSSNLVLGGTVLNCAGGPSPWGWLSAEETFSARHGLVFLCDPRAERIAAPRPIPAYGRFRHEAVCVDPATSIAYLTEDRSDGCLYRFVPVSPDRPFEGQLQAMTVRGRPGFDTARRLAIGERVEIGWVPVRDPLPERDEVRHVARRDGAALICRGEGMWLEPAGIVFAASEGGPGGHGQILRLEPDADGGELFVLAQSERQSEIDMPDNVVVSPHGIVYFCEDGRGYNHVRGIDAQGRVFDFARTARSELAGVCFAPDGSTMFLNLQDEGLTLAIRGPFAAA